MSASWTLVTPPTTEPITLADAKQQLRITDDASDAVLTRYIRAARQAAENVLRYGICTQTWRLDLRSWAEVITLPMAATLQSITHVKYYDTAGTLQTLSATYYTTDTIARPARLVRATGMGWPALQGDRRTGLIQITYVVGAADVALVSESVKHGIRLYLGLLDADRDGTHPDRARAEAAAERCWTDGIEWVDQCPV